MDWEYSELNLSIFRSQTEDFKKIPQICLIIFFQNIFGQYFRKQKVLHKIFYSIKTKTKSRSFIFHRINKIPLIHQKKEVQPFQTDSSLSTNPWYFLQHHKNCQVYHKINMNLFFSPNKLEL